jgi:hypothetical protein
MPLWLDKTRQNFTTLNLDVRSTAYRAAQAAYNAFIYYLVNRHFGDNRRYPNVPLL